MKTALPVLLTILLCAEPVHGQTSGDTLRPGDRIRVTYRLAGGEQTDWLTGTYRGRTSDQLQISSRMVRGSDVRELALSDLTRVEVAAGRSRGSAAKRGALWGAIGGAALGLLLSSGGCVSDAPDCSAVGEGMLATALVGGVGAGVGAFVGYLTGGESWREVRFPLPGPTR